jgi:hypothetical protein
LSVNSTRPLKTGKIRILKWASEQPCVGFPLIDVGISHFQPA